MAKTKRTYEKRSVGKRSKEKGKNFEKDIANLLSKWSGEKWRRVPQSGGWNKRVVAGDVFCEREYISIAGQQEELFVPVSVECKKQEGWNFAQLFRGSEKCPLRLFWEQATNDAETIKKLPIMIFSQNFAPLFIMIGTRTANRLVRLINLDAEIYGTWHDFNHIIVHMSEKDQVVIFSLADFLGWIPFETLLKLTV